MTTTAARFDAHERRMWAGRAAAFRRTAERLCAHPVPDLLDAAGVEAGVAHLDVGSGTGSVVEAAALRGAHVTAVDAEPDMVAATRARVPEARTEPAVLPQLPFGDGVFDAVTANFVLNHVGDPVAALTEMRRVLRPGGRLAVTLWRNPNAAGQTLLGRAMGAAGAVRPDGMPRPGVDFERTGDGVAGLLREAGLAGVRGDEIAWDHRAGLDEWWNGFTGVGVGSVGVLLSSLSVEGRADARTHYERLAAELARPDGLLALPHVAVLASGSRP
ncbi:class I SAM-dependent methyltransferase [Streptomyces sp. NPDC052225]|uniref:class I SAM-dependent methyltransferase n=1 Tax=Streptomyces sp. NPDC052225 TaxID=3154949 RepID=UPI0034348429